MSAQNPEIQTPTISRLSTTPGIQTHPSGILSVRRDKNTTNAELRSARDRLRYAAKKGTVQRLFGSTFIPVELWADDRRWSYLCTISAALAHPKRIVAGRAASLLHGLPLIAPLAGIDMVAIHSNKHATADSVLPCHIVLSKARQGTQHLQREDGIQILTVPQTVIDLAMQCPQLIPGREHAEDEFRRLAEAMAATDAALRGEIEPLDTPKLGLVPEQQTLFVRPPICVQELHAVLMGTPSRDRRRVELLVSHGSALSESPLESAVKVLLIVLGIRFHQQARMVHESGRFLARVDFYLPDHHLIIEADGLSKYDADTVRYDRVRDFRLHDAGFPVLHLTWKDVFSLDAIHMIRRQLQAPVETPRGRWLPQHYRLPNWMFS